MMAPFNRLHFMIACFVVALGWILRPIVRALVGVTKFVGRLIGHACAGVLALIAFLPIVAVATAASILGDALDHIPRRPADAGPATKTEECK